MARRPLRTASWLILAVLVLAAITAGWWAPIEPSDFLDPSATHFLPPGSKRIAVETVEGLFYVAESIERDGGAWSLARRGERFTLPLDEVQRMEPLAFRWGTDRLGRDVLSRTLHGGRISPLIALLAILLATPIAVAVGTAAGSLGGWTDEVLMRFCDGLLGFPRLILLLAIAAFSTPTFWTLVVTLALTSWMSTARLVRAEVRSLGQREFVLAATASGAPAWRVAARHVLPHLKPTLWVDTTLRFGELILLEASLSYLGLGVPSPTPSWGSMISEGQVDFVRAPWIAFFPGLALVATVLALTLLSDSYRHRRERTPSSRTP